MLTSQNPPVYTGIRFNPSRTASNCSEETLPAQPKQFCAAAPPFALYTAMFIVIVAVFQVPMCETSAARHGPNGEHMPTVALFEIRLQALFAVHRQCCPGGMILRPSPQDVALNFRLAALVEEQ